MNLFLLLGTIAFCGVLEKIGPEKYTVIEGYYVDFENEPMTIDGDVDDTGPSSDNPTR